MIEMLKARKEQLESRGEKGFTLMEMLIVIAIIAILIAIAIPLFMGQLNAAKAATDESNARALYAQLQSDYMLGTLPDDKPATIAKSGTVVYNGTEYKFSDVLESGTITYGATASDAPVVVSITTNGQTYQFGGTSS